MASSEIPSSKQAPKYLNPRAIRNRIFWSQRSWIPAKRLSAPAAAPFGLVTAGTDSLFQITGVGSVDPKNSAFHIFHRPNIHLVGKNISLADKPGQVVQKLGFGHLAHLLEEQPARIRRSRKSEAFQQGNLSATQINLAMHSNPQKWPRSQS